MICGGTMIIHPIMPDDIHSVMAIEYEAFKHPYPPELMNYLFSHYGGSFLVAEIEGCIVGYVIAIIEPEEAHIISIAVADGYKEKGIGTSLMDAIIGLIRCDGVKTIRLEVRKSNEKAKMFYERLGFYVSDTIKYYYEDGEAAYIMCKEL